MSANWNSYGHKFPVSVPGPAHYTLVWLQPHLQQGGHSKGTEYHLLPIRCSNPDKRSWSVSEVQAWPQPHQGLPEVSIANFLIHFTEAFAGFLEVLEPLSLLIKKVRGVTSYL